MATATFSKAALGQARTRLASYRRFLPSLDLKRRQLIAENNRARAQLAALEATRETLYREAGEGVPMLAIHGSGLEGLVRLHGARYGEQNLVGVILPVLKEVEIETRAYSYLARPHWVDRVVALLERALRLEVEIMVQGRRLELLGEAVKKVTQRINLFEKVLIPRTQAQIRRIQIFLGDAERAGVVTAKLAKAKQAAVT